MDYNEAITLLRLHEIKLRAKSMTPEWSIKGPKNESDRLIYQRQINLIHVIHASDTATQADKYEWRELLRLRA